ncbi:MBL fold metallo-hydrolase, partial [Candidatus Woesearchaeota archaeon]|nr:MBL fold metallo-hydrolase [Candidatus Woesearchaeota archaeon]
MKVTFLGTSSMVPTKDRNHSGILVNYKSDNILVDCGEGIQRQLRIADIFPTKITKILITHWHGDHVLGLPGFIDTLGKSNYSKVLEIYGPKGSKDFFNKMMQVFVPKSQIQVKITEVTKDGKLYENEDYSIEVYKMDHTALCYAYSLIEKPKRRMNMDYLKKIGLREGPILKD